MNESLQEVLLMREEAVRPALCVSEACGAVQELTRNSFLWPPIMFSEGHPLFFSTACCINDPQHTERKTEKSVPSLFQKLLV